MRLFVAIAMPPDVTEPLAALMAGLEGARWVDPGDLHLTLCFAGEVDGGTAEDLAGALAGLRSPAFDLRLAGFGRFGGGRRLRALWAGVDPQPLLDRLQGRIAAAARSAGIALESRRFVPHVTLARFAKGDAAEAEVERWIARHSPFAAGPFPVREAVLFESFPGRDGPHYEPRLAVPLDRLPDADDWAPGEWGETDSPDGDED